MRKILLLVSALALSGCAGLSQKTITDEIALVQADAQAICKFIPDAAVIAAMFTSNPIVATAESIAQGICAAITAPAAVRGKYPSYMGVRIRGHFVR